MLFLFHVSTLSAPFLFITADICETSKISVICKLASHISPFKTLIGLAVFTNPNASPLGHFIKVLFMCTGWESTFRIWDTGRKKAKVQRRQLWKSQVSKWAEGPWSAGSSAILHREITLFLQQKGLGALLRGKTPQGIEITFLRKVRSWFSRKNIYRQHLWGKSSDGGDTGCFRPAFLPSFSGYGTLAFSEAPSGWLTPHPWL